MTPIDIALLLLILLLGYYIRNLWKVVAWLVSHVHVVSKRDEKDPEMTRIKQVFGIDDDSQKGDGK